MSADGRNVNANPYEATSLPVSTNQLLIARKSGIYRGILLAPLMWLVAYPATVIGYFSIFFPKPTGPTGAEIIVLIGTVVGVLVAYILAFAILLPMMLRLPNRRWIRFPVIVLTCVVFAFLVSLGVLRFLGAPPTEVLTFAGILAVPAVCCCVAFEFHQLIWNRNRST